MSAIPAILSDKFTQATTLSLEVWIDGEKIGYIAHSPSDAFDGCGSGFIASAPRNEFEAAIINLLKTYKT